MTAFLVKRLLTLSLTLAVASVLIFAVLDVLPGDAAVLRLGETATPEAIGALKRQLGLDQPAWQRYFGWVGQALQGRTARSVSYDTPTAELLAERLQVTLPLALLAAILTAATALSSGLYAARHRGRAGDAAVMTFTQLGLAVPNFWLAILLVLVFAVKLQWVQAGGFPGWTADEGGGFGPGLLALMLPALSLALVQAAILARVTRSAVLDVWQEDCIRTARAKGLSERQVLWRHVLPNALIPILTVAGLQFANLLTGTIVIENVFVLPGVGRLIFQALGNRDLAVVRDALMLLVGLVVVVSTLVDVAVGLVDPRVRQRR
jgi:peptide/nickel transport system permease protein